MWKRSSRRTPGLQVGRRGTLSAPLFPLSSPRLSSSTPECFFMVWPLVKWSIVHQSMSSWALCAPQEIYCTHWTHSTVKTNMSVISGSLIQYSKSFKTAFVFGLCSSGCFRATNCLSWSQLPLSQTEWNAALNPPSWLFFPMKPVCPQGRTPCNPPFPRHH